MNRIDLTRHWKIDASGLAAIGAVLVLGYTALIAPALNARDAAEARAGEIASTQTKQQELESTLRSLNAQIETRAGSSELKLQPVATLNQRLADITALIGDCSLSVDAIEAGTTTGYERYATVAIRVTGRGSYPRCAALLRSMRTAMPSAVELAISSTTTSAPTAWRRRSARMNRIMPPLRAGGRGAWRRRPGRRRGRCAGRAGPRGAGRG